MEQTPVSQGTTQVQPSPVNTDNLDSLSSSDIAKQIEALQSQDAPAPVVEQGINEEVAPPAPEPSPTQEAQTTQETPEAGAVENVGLAEIERLRLEAEELRQYKQRYADSTREARELAERNRLLESQTKQAQEQQRRYTDEEVDAFVEQNPQYLTWGNSYKKESLILEVKESVRKEQEERETKTRYQNESLSALDQAKKDFPEAFKPGTQLQKLAAEIYSSRPAFKNDPKGVYYAAELAKARLIPASPPVTPTSVPNQAQPTANTPFMEKGNNSPAMGKVDLKSLSPEALSKLSLAELAKILPHTDQE